MRNFLLKAVFLLLSSQCLAQSRGLVLTGGLIYQKRWTGDFAIMYGGYDSGGPCNPSAETGVGLGAEFVSTLEGKMVIAPKIVCQAGSIIGFRASEINYLHSNGSVDVRLLPQIGIDMIWINLFYGYNIHLFGSKFTDISSHRVSLNFNLFVNTTRKKK